MNEMLIDGKSDSLRPALQYHAVLLYDLLGQSSKLRGITSIPETPDDKRRVAELLKTTAGAVLRMRTHIQSYYKNVSKSQIDPQTLASHEREIFIHTRTIELVIRNFSDLTIAHTPLMEAPGMQLPMTSIAALIGTASSMMFVSLIGGTPVRGALDVGLAVDLEGSEIYGPILDSVYKSETLIADWPRIVVGDSLVKYLDAAIQDPADGLYVAARRAFAQMGRQFIATDVDGQQIVDYLGTNAKAIMGARVPFSMVEQSHAFVLSEYNKFLKQGCVELTVRYEHVLKYFEARMSNWK